MENNLQTLQSELDVFKATRDSLIKEADHIKKVIKAKEKQIKAQEELIASLTPAEQPAQ